MGLKGTNPPWDPSTAHDNTEYLRWYKFGVDQEMYDEMVAEQDNCCAICGVHATEDKANRWDGTGSLNVDHCHETGLVRGLLCSQCNQGLGRFKDNIESLKKAIWYLEPIT